jgi:hypothetical protein
VRATEGKIEIRSFHSSAETDSVDFKILDEARGDAGDHVIDDAAHGAVEGTVFALLGGAGDDDVSVLGFQRDTGRNREVEFTFWAFDLDGVALDLYGDFSGQGDWFESDS